MSTPAEPAPSPPLSSAEQRSLLDAVARTTAAALVHLRASPLPSFPITFVAHLQRGVDQVVQARADAGLKTDCRAGCSHCCSVRVEALPAEIFAVAHSIKARPQAEQERVVQRLVQHDQRTQQGSHIDRSVFCPLLEEQLCTIYAVRPAACRKAHSLDVRQCQTAGADIPEDLDLVLRAEALSAGVAGAYRELGLQAGGHVFAPSLLRALQDDSAQLRWLAGEPVFD